MAAFVSLRSRLFEIARVLVRSRSRCPHDRKRETCRSIAKTSKSKPNQAWAAIVGLVSTHVAELWLGSCEIYDAPEALIP